MFKKYVYLWVVIIGSHSTLFSQYKLSGTIVDVKSKDALSGVSIYINDLKRSVKSDSNGHFEIQQLKKGTYFVEISMMSYKPVVRHIDIKKDTHIEVELISSHKELSEIIVTGVSRSTELKLSPIIIKSIDKNYLNQSTATNLVDALKNIPGIQQITTGAAISKPVIRGLGYNRVITLLNGMKQEGQQWGDEHGVEMDEYSIDKVEIIKGPGSLMYGSDGIAGVINFLSPKAPALGDINTQLVSNYQSNNNLWGHSISNSGNINGIQWLGRVSHKIAGNYQNAADGYVLNSGFKELNGTFFVGLNKNWGHTHFHFSSYNATMNLPEGERDSTGHFVYQNQLGQVVTATESDLKGYKTGFPHQELHHLRLSSNSYFILKKGTLNLDIGFQNNKRKEFGDAMNPNKIALYFDLNTINYNARYNLEKIKGWEITLGVGGMNQSNHNRGLEFLIPEYRSFDIGTFAYAQKSFKSKWTVAGGLRVDHRILGSDKLILDSLENPTSIEDSFTHTKFASINESFSGVSGSIGCTYQASKYATFKLNVSRGFRVPNIAELSSNGRHEGTFRYEIGSAKLKSEISHQIDVAYFLNNEHITMEITPFANFISNFIYTKKAQDSLGNPIIIDPNDPAPAYLFTQGNATLLGGEFYIDVHPHPFDWLHIANSFSYVQATQNPSIDSIKNMPFIPAPKYRGELKATFKKVTPTISNAFIKIGMDVFLTQNNIYSAYATETATPSYTLLSAGIGASVKLFNKSDFMNIIFNAENITNTIYQNHLSRLKYAPENLANGRTGIFNQGRNFSLKIILTI